MASPVNPFLSGTFNILGIQITIPDVVAIALGTFLLANYIMINQLIMPYVERKVMARQQGRRGPVYVGWRGILQIPADLLKLVLKEDTMPKTADSLGFFMAIFFIGVSSIMAFVPLPFANGVLGADLTIGVLYVFAIFSIVPPAMFIGGWASNSKYALIGGFRAAGQLLAYEIPMFISVLGVIAIVNSFSLNDIALYQMHAGWFLFSGFGIGGLIAAFVFYIAGLAETERVPFDIPEAEAELVMGPRTEFSGWRYALIMMTEYVHLTVNSLLFIFLFFGGFDFWPFGNAIYNFNGGVIFTWPTWLYELRSNLWIQFITVTVKAYFFIYVATTFRTAFPRMRIDQLLSFGWKQLLLASIFGSFIMIWSTGVLG